VSRPPHLRRRSQRALCQPRDSAAPGANERTDLRVDLGGLGLSVHVDDMVIRALVLAATAATGHGHARVGTPDLLEALIADGDPPLMSTLSEFAVDAQELRGHVLTHLRDQRRP
jgi:hypothetical protein